MRVLWITALLGILVAHGGGLVSSARLQMIPAGSWSDALFPISGRALLQADGPAWVVGATHGVLLCAVAVATGVLARNLHLHGAVAAACTLLVALSPASAGAVQDRAALLWLIATLSWLLALLLQHRRRLRSPTSRGRDRALHVAEIALLLLAVLESRGGFVPLLLPWIFAKTHRLARMGRWVDASVTLAILALPFVLRRWLPDVGFGHELHEGLNPRSGTLQGSVSPGPPFVVAVLHQFGFRGSVPFLLPDLIGRGYSHLWSGLLIFALLLAPAFLPRSVRDCARFATHAILLSALGAMWVATLGDSSAVSSAALLPGAVGTALLAGSLPRTIAASSRASWSAVGLFCVLFFIGALRLSGSTRTELFARAAETSPVSPYAAARLLESEGLGLGRVAVERAILERPFGDLPAAFEESLGLLEVTELDRRGEKDRAIDWLERWLSSRRDFGDRLPGAQAALVRLLLESNRTEAALEFLSERMEVLRERPEFVRGAVAAIVTFLSGRKIDAETSRLLQSLAEELLEPWIDQSGKPAVDARLALALVRSGQGRYIDAVKLAESAMREDPSSARPRAMLARIYLSLDQTEVGMEHIVEALRLEPDDPEAQFLQGRMLAGRRDRSRAAIGQMIAALRIDPAIPFGMEELAIAAQIAAATLRMHQDLESAQALIESTQRAMAPHALLHLELARIARMQSDGAAAERCYEEAHRLDPSLSEVRNEFAELLKGKGYEALKRRDQAAAVEAFRHAIALDPPEVSTDGMRWVLAANEDRTTAATQAPASDADRFEKARSAFEQAVSHLSKNQLEPAAEEFARSLSLAPANPLAHLHLGRIRVDQTRFSDAEEHLRLALSLGDELEIDVEYAYLLLARALLRQDKAADCRILLEQYKSVRPEGAYLDQIEAMLAQVRETSSAEPPRDASR